MTLNVTLPASQASSPASNAQAATANASSSSQVKSKNTAPASRDTSATVETTSPSAQADTLANAASDADLFARMLGAQMNSLNPVLTAQAAGVTVTAADKPAKAATPLSTTMDPALLLNPALAALQQPVVPLPTAIKPDTAAATPPLSAPAATQGVAAGAPSSTSTNGAARPDAKLAAEADKTAFDELTRAATARQDVSLQKLPQDGAGQPTILPQIQPQAAAVEAAKITVTPQSYNIDQHVGTPAWSKAIGEHVMTMVNMKAETAHIQVSPPQLGPIEVMVKMDAHNNAQLTFTADSPATRAALENSLPKLHSMMAASGIQLGDAQVSGGQSQRQQQQSSQQNRFRGQSEVVDNEEMDTLASIKAARGMLSIFA